ncbi:peptide-methionine (S)-S-oxide reductase MsrA [Enterococcus hermanniensis]
MKFKVLKETIIMRTTEEILKEIYNLILNPSTREWERYLLTNTKDNLEAQGNESEQLAKLEMELRPLAIRNNLTPDVSDFYQRLIGKDVQVTTLDEHQIRDPQFQERAIFAGGCFWCMVEPFETQAGIVSVLSGYTGGKLSHPSYDQVNSGMSGHVEAVEIIFDTRIISYQDLLDLYWQIIDPTDALGQFQDRGLQYRPIIFTTTSEQIRLAESKRQQIVDSNTYKKPIIVEIKEAASFWPAENYHQEFYKKQPKRYKAIKRARQQFLTYRHLRGKLRNKIGLKNLY